MWSGERMYVRIATSRWLVVRPLLDLYRVTNDGGAIVEIMLPHATNLDNVQYQAPMARWHDYVDALCMVIDAKQQTSSCGGPPMNMVANQSEVKVHETALALDAVDATEREPILKHLMSMGMWWNFCLQKS